MPKRQKVLETAAETVTAPETKKKKAADKSPSVAKTPAATHKRAAGKTKKDNSDQLASSGGRTIQEAALETAAIVASEAVPTIPVLDKQQPAPTHAEIALRAYYYFLARGCQHGADVEDWCRAELELMELA
jgi:hypothetical protein